VKLKQLFKNISATLNMLENKHLYSPLLAENQETDKQENK